MLDESTISHAELLLVKEILDKGDNNVKESINNDVKRFMEVFFENMHKKGIKWDDIVLIFEWSFEADQIRRFLDENTVRGD